MNSQLSHRPFAVGGSCGIMATCVIQPMDMIKVRIQLGGVGTNPLAVGAHIVKSNPDASPLELGRRDPSIVSPMPLCLGS